MKKEEDLVQRGDLEVPELTNYMIGDEQYLLQALRISGLVKEYKNNDKETIKDKKMVRAVNELSLSMFKN